MKKNNNLFFSALVVICVSGCAHIQKSDDVLFQTATINALMEGVYDGDLTCGELLKHGDFAIGTFNNLDGEMVGLDGKIYQVKADGKVYPADGSTKTPFAVITTFGEDKTVIFENITDYKDLTAKLDGILETKGIFQAIKITGTFDHIKTRSVPKQNKPYPKLLEAVKEQAVFEFNDIEGTMVGFRCPDFVKGINVPGYHIHFLTKEKNAGGHLLECRMKNVKVEIDDTSGFYMVLPESGDFHKVSLADDKSEDLEKIEK